MTKNERKKEIERELVNRFANANPSLGISKIRDFESPDFLCETIDGACGIEVADFVFNPDRARLSLGIARDRRRMEEELNDEHRKRGLPPLNVWVRLLWHNKLRESSFRQDLKQLLIDLVAKTGWTDLVPITIEREDVGESLYERGVCSVLFIGGSCFSRPCWTFPHGACLPESEPEMVQSLVDKKNSKVKAYRQNVLRNWLLITAGPLGLDSMIEATDSILNAKYGTTFNRLFLFRTFGSHTHELRIQSPLCAHGSVLR